MLRAYVYCHVQDLNNVSALKEKAINFCYGRNISIIGFCSCGVTSLIYLMIESKADTLLINNPCRNIGHYYRSVAEKISQLYTLKNEENEQ